MPVPSSSGRRPHDGVRPLSDQLRRETTHGELSLAALRRYPERIAFHHGSTSMTYRQLEQAATSIAEVLSRRGFRAGDGVVLLTGNSPHYFATALAASCLGGRITGLHPLGSPQDHHYIIEDSDARFFIFNGPAFDDRVGPTLAALTSDVEPLSVGPSEHVPDLMNIAEQANPRSPLRSAATSDTVASLTYSSGTTGMPKGVVQKHRTAVELLHLSLLGWQLPVDDLRYLAATPVSHAAQVFVLPAWLSGGTVVLQDGFDPDAFCHAIQGHRITCTFLVPTMLYALLDSGACERYDLSSLRTVVYGAAPMSPSRLEEALGVFGPVFVQMYGQAEAPAAVCSLRTDEHDLERPHLLASCGKPIPGVLVELHDDDDNEVPIGAVGEICVRSRLVCEGYWKQPEQTAELFRNGWLHTGDMARRDQAGYIYIVDRKKDMIITGGMNIFAREVEDVLAEHPAVALAAVIGIPDEHWGEAIKAVVVTKPDQQVSADELIAMVRERKGPVHAPKSIDFADAVPLTALGKPDRKALRAPHWATTTRQVH